MTSSWASFQEFLHLDGLLRFDVLRLSSMWSLCQMCDWWYTDHVKVWTIVSPTIILLRSLTGVQHRKPLYKTACDPIARAFSSELIFFRNIYVIDAIPRSLLDDRMNLEVWKQVSTSFKITCCMKYAPLTWFGIIHDGIAAPQTSLCVAVFQ